LDAHPAELSTLGEAHSQRQWPMVKLPMAGAPFFMPDEGLHICCIRSANVEI
jgi:hypothetical protein